MPSHAESSISGAGVGAQTSTRAKTSDSKDGTRNERCWLPDESLMGFCQAQVGEAGRRVPEHHSLRGRLNANN